MNTPENTPYSSTETTPAFFGMLRRRWRYLTTIPISVAIVAFATSFLLPVVYTSETTFISSELLRATEPGSIQQKLQGMASSLGAGGLMPSSSLTEMLPSLSESREVLGGLLDETIRLSDGSEVKILEFLNVDGDSEAERREVARKKLIDHVLLMHIEETSGVVTLEATASDPLASAEIANDCARAVQDKAQELYTNQASDQLRFINSRLEDVGAKLKNAEEDLVKFREQNRMANQSPQLRMQEGRLMRKVQLQEQLYITLQTQAELAKIEEAKNTSVLSIIDTAVPAPRPSGPKRALIAISAMLVALATLATFFVLRDSSLIT